MTRGASNRNLLWWLTLGYTAFVIYGSLVPLRFRARPLDEAWAYFQQIPYLELGIGSRADWVANILLFVPLAFLWHAILWPNRGWVAKALASGFVLVCCVSLSGAIEFAQVFFPPRTVSLNDIIAEGIGAVIGTATWWSMGGRVTGWLAGWAEARTPRGTAERLLYAYLFLLFGYSVLPLDLTISAVEIYHKWNEGKVLLVPFSAVYETGAQRAYALLADVAIWIPAAFLWKLSSPRPARQIVFYVLAWATIIEVLQLFVYSRVTSTTDVLMAGCGGAIGVSLAQWLRPGASNQQSPRSFASRGGLLVAWILAVAGWTGVLMVVFWYPFNFSTEWGFVHERLGALQRVPFEAYYFGTEFRAVTEVFHKTGFFFPLGALLAVGAVGIRRRLAVPAVLVHAAGAVVVACAAAGIEIGQLFLPGKIADTTDWLLETVGGLAGYFCLRILIPRWQGKRVDVIPRPAPDPHQAIEVRNAPDAPSDDGGNEFRDDRCRPRNGMDRTPSSTATYARPTGLEPLMALGMAMLAWLACAWLLAMYAATPTAGEAAGGRGIHVSLGHFFVPLLAGLLCQSSTSSLLSRRRLLGASGLWAAWTMLGTAAAVIPHQMGLQGPWSLFDLLMQQGGLVLGIALGWFVTPALARALCEWLRPCEAITRGVIVATSIAIMLVPLAPDASLLNPANGWHIDEPAGYLKALPSQIYLALKSLILWVPLGMLYALAQRQAQLRGWARAGALAFLIVGLPLLYGTLTVQDLVEILGAYWGISLGVMLGTEVYRTVQAETNASQIARSDASSATDRPAMPTKPQSSATAGILLRRTSAVLLLLGVGSWAWLFPRWGMWVLCGLALYALWLCRYRNAWLLVVPAALPLLNLAPGTGRFFFDEFDMLLVTTVAMALWHGGGPLPRPIFSRMLGVALMLFGLSIAVSLAIGLLPLSALDANAFTNYFSHYNSLRVAKGFLWALPLLALMVWTLPAEPGLFMRLFVPGMWLGLAGVIAVGVWERWLFASLVDLSVPYRITATFSSMHTGGSEIETYLVTAIPFVWLAFGKEWPAAVRLAGLGLLVLGAYLMALTIARGGVLALSVALCILLLSAWRTAPLTATGKGRAIVAAIGVLGAVATLALGLTGGYLQKRLANAGEDWSVRVSHWQTALTIRDQDIITTLFGMGLGRFPENYLFRSGAASLPSTYAFLDEDGNRFLRLGGGETLYMAQQAPVSKGRRYTLSVRMRTNSAGVNVGLPLCEKNLLNSFRCHWHLVPVPADGDWHAHSVTIDTGPVGGGNWFTRRPVELSLYNETEGTLVDVDDVQLQDEAGERLIQNGDFSAGGDYWFFKTHSHLPWHIKNLWVEVLFEQGWFGLISFLLLLAALVGHLVRAVWRGDRFAGVLLASTGGFLTVGLFGSLFDTPRIATLFFLLVTLAGLALQGVKRR